MVILVGFIIAFSGLILSALVDKYSRVWLQKSPNRFKHKLYVAIYTMYYVSEITFVFGVFCFIIDNTLMPIAYEEASYLKRFIDFFTVYQISLFVILRIINSQIMSSYRLLLSEIRRIRNFIDAGLPLDDYYDEFNKESNNYALHPDVRFLYKELRLTMQYYQDSEKRFINGDYDETKYLDTLKKFNASLNSKEMLIEARIIDKEREWEGSLILRSIRNQQLKIRRDSREKELEKVEKLYLSGDE